MKNYKNIVPIVLLALFVLGIYMKYDKNTSVRSEYTDYVNTAREYHKLGIHVDAQKNYLAAIEVSPNLALYIEVGEFYKSVSLRDAIDWGEEIIEIYPNESGGYEFLLGVYKEAEAYEDFFELYSTVKKRGIETKAISEMKTLLSREYYYDGNFSNVGYYAENYCAVMDEDLWKYVNMKGSSVTSYNFTEANNFCDGVAAVRDKLGDTYFVDYEGNKKYIVENLEKVEKIGCYKGGICTVYDGTSWGVYNLKGELQYGTYADISSFSNGVIAVKENEKWRLLDEAGKILIEDTYDDVKQDEKGVVYRNSRLFVSRDGNYYMIDAKGKKITETAYEDAKIFNGNSYAAVKLDGKWGFVNQNGEIVIEPMYDDARSFANGFAAVKVGEEWGFIDEQNEIFIECQFRDVRDFTTNGSVFVLRGNWQLLKLYSYNY